MIKFREKHIGRYKDLIRNGKPSPTDMLSPSVLLKDQFYILDTPEFWTIIDLSVGGHPLAIGHPLLLGFSSSGICRNRKVFIQYTQMHREFDFLLTDLEVNYLEVYVDRSIEASHPEPLYIDSVSGIKTNPTLYLVNKYA